MFEKFQNLLQKNFIAWLKVSLLICLTITFDGLAVCFPHRTQNMNELELDCNVVATD